MAVEGRDASTVTAVDIHGESHVVAVDALRWRPSVYAVIVKDDALLVSPQFGAYALPGGGVELGETLEEALTREVYEETGIRIASPKLLTCHTNFFVMSDSDKGEFIQSLLFYYLCDFAGGELSSDHFTEDEKPNMAMPEWLPLSKLTGIAAGGSDDWRTVVNDVIRSRV